MIRDEENVSMWPGKVKVASLNVLHKKNHIPKVMIRFFCRVAPTSLLLLRWQDRDLVSLRHEGDAKDYGTPPKPAKVTRSTSPPTPNTNSSGTSTKSK